MKGKYIMKKPKPVQPFKSLEEETDFWDTHDLSAVVKNPKISISKLLLLEPKKEVVMTLRVQKSVKEKIENLAKIKGLNVTTLARMWLIEKLTEEESVKKHSQV
ncbi:MAG: hypothetical protein US72_C0003G0023 [Microgenomates group bacterium GW2011_GWC1_38_12]|nr:MAG: hypothetical protein US72_C0003G0023 [Microgenomates group bacterium GW2011_GWC1_38_12]KKS76705.1 MAG: hypothetical protein UV50_C0016G0002 [Parcubacteria group bacterium GW2011_GWB1_42_9]